MAKREISSTLRNLKVCVLSLHVALSIDMHTCLSQAIELIWDQSCKLSVTKLRYK